MASSSFSSPASSPGTEKPRLHGAPSEWGAFDLPEARAACQKLLDAATDKMPHDAFEHQAWQMGWIHKMLLNQWKSLYWWADKFEPSDFKHFRKYAEEVMLCLEEHHDTEETVYFPPIEERLSLSQNREPQKSFLPQVEDLLAYIRSTDPAKPSTFNATTFREKIDATLPPMLSHMSDELDTLEAGKLRVHFSGSELNKIQADVEAALKKHNPFTFLPLSLQSVPPGSVFPPFPFIVRKVLAPWVFYWKHKGAWKYCAYPFKKQARSVPTWS